MDRPTIDRLSLTFTCFKTDRGIEIQARCRAKNISDEQTRDYSTTLRIDPKTRGVTGVSRGISRDGSKYLAPFMACRRSTAAMRRVAPGRDQQRDMIMSGRVGDSNSDRNSAQIRNTIADCRETSTQPLPRHGRPRSHALVFKASAIASAKTWAPSTISSLEVSSVQWWLTPLMLGTNIMAVGNFLARNCASCAAPLGI
jgi:hypothetical protein